MVEVVMRMIDADALIELYDMGQELEDYAELLSVPIPIIRQNILDAPTIDAKPVKHGRWILGHVEPGYFTPGGNRPWICSECGQVISWMLDEPKENYCRNCGAKMGLGGANE
jgi:hypothetical protein